MKASVLVVATITADSDDLLEALRAKAAERPAQFTLLAPAVAPGPEGREAARQKLEAGLARLREAGLDAEGRVGNSDPLAAVQEIWDPRDFDEIIVSTLGRASSKWLMVDVPHRLQRMCDVPVSHILSAPRQELRIEAPPEREDVGVLKPLTTLAWGRKG